MEGHHPENNQRVLSIDLIYLIAEQCDTPAEVLKLAKLNRATWAVLEPLLYRKEVTYTRASQRLPYGNPGELFQVVIGAFGGLTFPKLDDHPWADRPLPKWPDWAGKCILEPVIPHHWDHGYSEAFRVADEWHEEHLALQNQLEKENKHGLALLRAINDGKNMGLVRRLIQSALLHNKRGYLDGLDFPILPSPLHYAAASGHVPTIRLLLAAGCTANNFFGDLNEAKLDADGATYASLVDEDDPKNLHGHVPAVVKFLSTIHLDPTPEMIDFDTNSYPIGIYGGMGRESLRLRTLKKSPTPAAYAARFGKTAAMRVLLDAQTSDMLDEQWRLLIEAARDGLKYMNAGAAMSVHWRGKTYPERRACTKTTQGLITHPTIAECQSTKVQWMRANHMETPRECAWHSNSMLGEAGEFFDMLERQH